VPVYNGEATLERCLGSIVAHAPEDVRIVVSDNASTDGTEAIGRAYASSAAQIRYVRQPSNIGGMANFRFLLEQAATPYFMWLADDDWLGDDFIERALRFMEGKPDYVLATFGASAYYSRHDGAYQFTTLTSGIEDEDPRRRVELFVDNLADNSEFYGIYRRAMMRFDPPQALGADWVTMIDTSYLGKIRTLEGTLIHRQNRWDTPDRHAAVAAGAGLPAAQGEAPHYATALAALVHIAVESPVYSGLPEEARLMLAASVLRRFRRLHGLPERIQFWPDAERLFGDAFASRHGRALRTILDRACAHAREHSREALAPEVLELALSLNLGGEGIAAQPESRPEPDGDSLAALASRALHEPAYRHPRISIHPSIPYDLVEEHARFLTTPETFFDIDADIDAYAAHQLRIIDALLPDGTLSGQTLRLSQQRLRAIGALVRRLNVLPCHMARGSLKELMEKRAALASLLLRQEGTQVDAEVQGGGAGGRLRVGLLVRDALSPAEAHTSFPAISHLDRGRFETVALVTQLGGGTGRITPTEQHCFGLAERALLLGGDLNAMAAAVRAENFDFLLFGSNLTAAPSDVFFLSLCRLARWQLALNPCRTTTGSEHIDFFVSGSLIEAGTIGQEAYSERLLMMEGPAHARTIPPSMAEVATANPSASRGDREIRLVSGAGCLKLAPAVRAAWMRLLASLPGATLSLLPFRSPISGRYGVRRLEEALARDARSAGVDIARVRVLEPFPSVAARRGFLGTMDIYLDSFPVSGLHSLLDPLMAGIPAVTLAGDSYRSNLGASVLRECGFSDWIASTPERYVSIVSDLASSGAALRRAKEQVHETMKRGTRFFESAWYSGQTARMLDDIVSGRIGR
jgi:hypothetical protein